MEMLLIIPVVILLTMVMFGIALHYRDKHGTWAGPARLIFFGWLGLITLDIPLKLTSLAIHCAFWTGFHVEPGRFVTVSAAEWCDAACVEALVTRSEPFVVRTVTYPKARWDAGESWDLGFRLTNEDWYSCRDEWEKVRVAAAAGGVSVAPDPELCLRYQRLEGRERPALYELRDEIDQTKSDSIFWPTFKRGFEVWDIEADQVIAWFRGYEIRLWWLYPLELGCPADRSFLTDSVVVLEPIQS